MAEGKARRTGGWWRPTRNRRTARGSQVWAHRRAISGKRGSSRQPLTPRSSSAPGAADPAPGAADPAPAAEDPALTAADLVLAADPALAAADPAQAAAAATAGGGPPFARRLAQLVRIMRSKTVRFGFLAAVLVLLGLALTDQAGTLWHEVQQLSAPVVALAFVLNLAGSSAA